MEKRTLIAFIVLTLSTVGLAQEWGYDSPIGPNEWSSLSSSYVECGNGMMQSPINILSADVLSDEGIGLLLLNSDKLRNGTLSNDGHTVEFQAGTNSDLTEQPILALVHEASDAFFSGRELGDRYYLNSLDFHWGSSDSQGSEHYLNNVGGVGEVHFNYYNSKYDNYQDALNKDDGLTIIAFLLQLCAMSDFSTIFGTNNEYLEMLSANGSRVTGISWSLADLHECSELFSGVCKDKFYVYFGSLTTPPCYQSALWWVSEQTRCVTNEQLQILREQRVSVGGELLVNNYRPVQDLNGRTIIEVGSNAVPTGISQVSNVI